MFKDRSSKDGFKFEVKLSKATTIVAEKNCILLLLLS